jgi:hypothetical protein
MPFSGMWRRVGLVLTNVSEERSAYVFKVDVTRSSETSFLTRRSRRSIAEDGILYSQRRESPKSYKKIFVTNYRYC